MAKRSVNVVLKVALFAALLSIPSPVVWADESGAAAAIASSRSQMIVCYDAAKEAEAAGGNITTLAGTLNDAGLLLSHAEYAFSVGNFVSAQDFAVRSQHELVDFVSDANALLIAGEAKRSQDFLINVVGSMGGAVVVLVGGFGLWSLLKRKFQKGGDREIGPTAV